MRIELTAEDLARAEVCIPRPKARKAGITPGKVVFWGWHYPKMVLREGIGVHLGSWTGKRALQKLLNKPELLGCGPVASTSPPLRVSSLTSSRHTCITAVALRSLENASGRSVAPTIHDDGSLADEHRSFLKELFPAVRFVDSQEASQALEHALPETTYPFLRKLREGFFMMRKFIDAHVVDQDWKTVMDADVFFFRRPDQLLACIDEGRWAHMTDCQTSYGCPVSTLKDIAGKDVHPRLNAGLVHMCSAAVDWDVVEYSAKVILSRHGWSYYLEQALLAVLMAVNSGEALDAQDYLVYPTADQVADPQQVAHHYVDRSSMLLFSHGWKSALRDGGAKVPGSGAPRC